jgi:hypothetical protein
MMINFRIAVLNVYRSFAKTLNNLLGDGHAWIEDGGVLAIGKLPAHEFRERLRLNVGRPRRGSDPSCSTMSRCDSSR